MFNAFYIIRESWPKWQEAEPQIFWFGIQIPSEAICLGRCTVAGHCSTFDFHCSTLTPLTRDISRKNRRFLEIYLEKSSGRVDTLRHTIYRDIFLLPIIHFQNVSI